MRLKIPYLTTTPMQDLKITLALTPLWWLLGLYFVIYHFAVFLSITKMVILRNKHGRQVVTPGLSRWLIIFLGIFLLSICINSFINEPQRTFAALNNFSVYIMGFFMIIIIYNSANFNDLVDFMKIAGMLAIIGGILVLIFLSIWLAGYHDVKIPTLLGRLVPSLNDFPYFYVLNNITITDTDFLLFQRKMPRIPVFTSVKTISGGQMLVLIPLLIGYWTVMKKINIWRLGLLTIPLSVSLLSLSRAPVLALIVVLGLIIVFGIKLSRKGFVIMMIFMIVIPTVIILKDYIIEFFNLVLSARGASTRTRFALYQEAIDITLERNPIIGTGIKVREEFTMRAIGSHSTYMAHFIMTGILGVFAFLMFEIAILVKWVKARNLFLTEHNALWLYFGGAFIGLSLLRFTETLDSVPYISFLYFLTAGVLISLEKISVEKMT